MGLFWLLVLAHLVGDFPLQTDKVFYYKHKTRWGILIHIGITAACNVVFTIPYLKYPTYWLILLGMSVLHLLYDKMKISLTRKGMEDNTLLFLFDQFLHFATIYIATIVFYYLYPYAENSIGGIWANMPLIQIATGLMFIVFAIAPVNYFIINDYYRYFKKLRRPHWQFPTGSERKWGYLERAILALAILLEGWFLIFIPAALLPRILFAKNNNILDFTLSIFFTIGISLWLQHIINFT